MYVYLKNGFSCCVCEVREDFVLYGENTVVKITNRPELGFSIFKHVTNRYAP